MPEWTSELRARLAALRLNPAREAEIVEELSAHLDQRYDELRGRGVGEADARALAIDELLDPDALARYMRPLRQANQPAAIAPGAPRRRLLGDVGQDLRYAVRMLRRTPGFTSAAVLTVALGIGANSAIFALVDAILLRPLPIAEPDRVVMLWETTATSRRGGVSPLNLRDWADRTSTFAQMAGFTPNVGSMVMGGVEGIAETIPRQWVTAGFFDVLGVSPVAGRTFLPADDRDRANVVVVSEGFWRARFNADPGVVGRAIRLDGDSYTIVGVAPDEAQLFGRTSIWALLQIEDAPPPFRSLYLFRAVGRLQPGASAAAAAADLAAVADGLAREHPKTNAGRGAAIEALDAVVIGSDLRQTSILFLGVVGFVLLICCANVASLLLARGTARTRELAIRTALGADSPRLVRQLLTESLVLSFAGGALGLAIGAGILAAAPSVVPQGLLPPAVDLAFDLRVVLFCAAAALIVGLLFGLAPAWQATRSGPASALSAEGRTTTGRGGRLRSALVAAEVAIAVVLLFGAGLLLRTLMVVSGVDRGYGAAGILTMIIDPLGSQYPDDAALIRFYKTVAGEVGSLPGVQDVAWASTLPLGRSYAGTVAFELAGEPAAADGQRPSADYQIVSPSYFRTLDLPILAGREFGERDTADAMPVCIVNEGFVRRHLAGRSPLGARVAVRSGRAGAPPVVREIVGVARQVKGRPDETDDFVQLYVPLAQEPVGDIFLVVRPATGRADALAPSVRAAIGRVDREQLVSVRSVMTLDDVAWEATSRYRFRAVLVAAFALLALLLAAVGLFGVLAYTVQQRTREFGVRRALGASAADVLRPVVGSAFRVVSVGAVAGLLLAAALSRFVAAMLFGVAPLDPLTIALLPLALAVTSALAIAGPAWRALRVDPAVALRWD